MDLHRVNLMRAGCQLDGSSWQRDSETVGSFGLGQVLSPRGRHFQHVIAGVEKVGDSPCCPFLPAGGIRLVNERLLSSAGKAQRLGIRAIGGLLIDRSGGHLSISTNYD